MALRPIRLATSNPAKRAQLRWLLEGLPLLPAEAPAITVAEDAPTLAGNAVLKALAYSGDGLAIASDGGLEVPGLGSQWDPRFTQRQGQARLRELARELTDRRVRWSEAVAVAEHGRSFITWTESGTEGLLAPEPWPDPTEFWVWDIFVFPEVGKTWAQLTEPERARLDGTWMALKREAQRYFG